MDALGWAFLAAYLAGIIVSARALATRMARDLRRPLDTFDRYMIRMAAPLAGALWPLFAIGALLTLGVPKRGHDFRATPPR